jgi:uncharacterized Zn-binding protein involved in type VI secretion
MRIADTTAHGGTIVVGFPQVIIGNMPASRIGDNHVCPMVTGVVPHVGGPFVTGAWTTLVGYVPQSRVTDFLVCVGPPDVALKGEPTVLVGMAGGGGGFGAILGGLMAGLANFLGGYPRSVLRPDGTVVTEYSPSITIEGSPQYQAAVVADLNQFTATQTGQRWAEQYADTGHHITIKPIPAGTDQNNGYTNPASDADASVVQNADGTETPGPGSDATIEFNPSRSTSYTGEDGNTYTRQPFETIGHELIHGLHEGQGQDRYHIPDTQPGGDNQEEAQTIGVHGFDDRDVSERALSEELRGTGSARPDHDSITGSHYQDEHGNWHEVTTAADGTETDTVVPAPVGGGPPNH